MELICYDDAGEASGLAPLYRRLIDEDKVDLVVGGSGTNVNLAALPEIRARQRFFAALMALGANNEMNYENYFAMIPNGPDPNVALTEAILPDPAIGSPPSATERMADLLEEMETADQVGLDEFGIGEHHRAEYLDSAPRDHPRRRSSPHQIRQRVTVLSAAVRNSMRFVRPATACLGLPRWRRGNLCGGAGHGAGPCGDGAAGRKGACVDVHLARLIPASHPKWSSSSTRQAKPIAQAGIRVPGRMVLALSRLSTRIFPKSCARCGARPCRKSLWLMRASRRTITKTAMSKHG